jgi:hypothetical protein
VNIPKNRVQNESQKLINIVIFRAQKKPQKKVELDNVGSVQFTETDCIISVKDLNTKEKLISGGITLKNIYSKLYDLW